MVSAGDMTPATIAPMPNTPGTPRRTVRIADPLWDAAMAASIDRGENLSEEIRKFLEQYAEKGAK